MLTLCFIQLKEDVYDKCRYNRTFFPGMARKKKIQKKYKKIHNKPSYRVKERLSRCRKNSVVYYIYVYIFVLRGTRIKFFFSGSTIEKLLKIQLLIMYHEKCDRVKCKSVIDFYIK